MPCGVSVCVYIRRTLFRLRLAANGTIDLKMKENIYEKRIVNKNSKCARKRLSIAMDAFVRSCGNRRLL